MVASSTAPAKGPPAHRQQAGNLQQDIAIVGLSCRLGGDAKDTQSFWDMLCDGKDAHTRHSRFNPPSTSSSDGKDGSSHGSGDKFAGHYLRQDPYAFDAAFFDIPRKEAKAMDPSQRLMLEVAHEAIENTGLTLDQVRGSNTSCYVGQFVSDYREMVFRDPDSAPTYTVTGTGTSLISNRLSWFFDLRGPSFTINTACSSSMVALHEACESLRHGEATMSIVGGSNMILSPEMFTYLRNQGFLAPDGRCKTFDASANGYGRGEGVAAMVLMPVEEAVRAGHPVRAVIRGTGVNQNGRTKSIVMPSAEAQVALIERTYESAGLHFGETTYVETHGTGTQIGDRLELEAIAQALARGRHTRKRLLVGSCKPNIGHTEATAGLAGIIKGILALESGLIPPNIHLKQANPQIPFDDWALHVPTEATVWPSESLRRMSACSTGYSGTNAHVILDDAYHYLMHHGMLNATHFTRTPANVNVAEMLQQGSRFLGNQPPWNRNGANGAVGTSPQRLFIIQAQDQEGVKRQGAAITGYLKRQAAGSAVQEQFVLRDLAHTLSAKRSPMPWRSAFVAASSEELQSQLIAGGSQKPQKTFADPQVCFVFTGQGAQWAQMGLALYGKYAVFRDAIDAASAYLEGALTCPWSPTKELFREASSSHINDPFLSQTLCTVLQVALVDLLASWGVRAGHVVGHSSGEIAGAYCRGALSREDAWKVAYYRGFLSSRMLESFPDLNGGMMAVGLGEEEARAIVAEVEGKRGGRGQVVVACVNSPSSVTLSGDADALDAVQVRLEEQGKFARRLKVRNAYHSPHMERIASDYVYAIRDIAPMDSDSDCQMFSAVTGDLIDPWELGPLSWMKNLVSPVRFSEAVSSMLASTGGENNVFVEIGPHSALQGPVRQVAQAVGGAAGNGIEYTSILSRGKDAVGTAMAAAGFLYRLGVPVDITKVNADQAPGMLVDLPPYAWNHSQSYTSVSRMEAECQLGEQEHGVTGLLGRACPTTSDHGHKWRSFMRPSKLPWLADHQIEGSVLFPAAGYLVLAVEAAQKIAEVGRKVESFRLEDVSISAALVVPEDDDFEVVVELRPHFPASRSRAVSGVWWEFSICSCVDGSEMRENCSGRISVDYESPAGSAQSAENQLERKAVQSAYTEARDSCSQESAEDSADFYKYLSSLGLNYGPAFAKVSTLLRGNGLSCCTVATQPWESQEARPAVIHPGTLDAMFHAVFAAARYPQNLLNGAMVPTFIEQVIVGMGACEVKDITYTGVATAEKHGLSEMRGDISMLSAATLEPLVKVSGMNLHATNPLAAGEGSRDDARHLCSSLSWVAAPEDEIKAVKAHGAVNDSPVVILQAIETSATTTSLEELIIEMLAALGVEPSIVTWGDKAGLSQLRGANCIALVEINQREFLKTTEDAFQALQGTVAQCKALSWISTDDAAGSIIPGFARTIRNENPALTFRTVQVDNDSLGENNVEKLAKALVNLVLSKSPDMELRSENGELVVPRLGEDHHINTLVSDIANDRDTMENRPVSDDGTVQAVDLSVLHPGNLSTLYFRPHVFLEELKDDEVEIEVRASGMNFRDVMVGMGAIPDLTMGFEAAGVVRAVGSSVTKFKVGDRVAALGHGAHCSVLRNKEALTQHIPDVGGSGTGMSFEAAATLPLVFVTAYNALVRVARAGKGRSVLIHAAAGGVGQAAIQIAQHLGMVIYATVGSQDKRALLKETYGLEDACIFSSRDTSFSKAIKRVTGGRGVDVVLNSLAGESLRESWHCIAPFGTFIEIGLKDIQQNSALDMRPFMQDATFSFFNVSRMMKEAPEIVQGLLDDTFSLIRDGVLQPIAPLTSFSISEVETAFRTMQTGKHRGKIALSWVHDQPVPTLIKCRSKLRLRADATYVLAGGLGGLGRSLAILLADCGAKHICFTSRSGAKADASKQLLGDLQHRGVDAWAYACDVADAKALAPLAEICSRKHHAPIRGIIQCAMVLQDVLFEKMTFDQWQTSLRPKVQGSANLANLAPEADFFIMLSSFAGIFGNPTQSNYAAGCAFQDALAHECRARGQKATAIDVGIMRDVGYLAEHGAVARHLKEWEGPFGVREAELHALIRLAIADEVDGAQLVTGLATGGTAEAAGMKDDPPFYFSDPKFSVLAQAGLGGGDGDKAAAGGGNKPQELQESIAKSTSREEAQQKILDALQARAAKLLQMGVDDIDVGRPLHAHGVDSLVAVEIRTWLFQNLKSNVSTFDLTATMPMKALASKITAKCELVPEEVR